MAIMLRKPYKAPKSSKPRKVNKPCLSSSIAPHNPANAFLGPRRGSRDRSNALAKHGKHGKQQQQAYEAKQGNKALSYDLESLVDMT